MKKILVADDEEQNLAYLQTLFQSQGFQVTTARNGEQALEAARENPPLVIISDILMPIMDGFMLCREWKNDSRLQKIPFVFYTATYIDSKDEKLALDLGADLFIIKPQEPDILLNLVQKIIDSKSKTSATKITEEDIMKKYNETLFRKLEKKLHQLEEANKTIKESEMKYRSIFENSISGIFRITKEGQLLTSNPALYRMLGYSSLDELTTTITNIGKQLFVYQDDHVHLIKSLKQNNYMEGFETRLYKKDGSIIWTKANIWTISDDNNHLLSYEGIIQDITDRIQKEENLKTSAEELKNAMMGAISVVSTIVEQRDPYTGGHQHRVGELAAAIAEELELTSHQIEGVRIAGLIHDVGKISIPSEILIKPTKLSPIERSLVELHAETGFNILKGVDYPWPILDAIHQHHERLNGSGYPAGLSNEEIIIEARILAVADVVEAMASHRPYRPAFGIHIALEEIEKYKGILYDADVVNACLVLFRNKNYNFF